MSAFAYLHGFASGPGSRKARAFADHFASRGVEVVVPSLDQGDFQHFTLTRARAVVDSTLASATAPVVLFASSMGAYLALLHAASHPVDALVLMAPAVDFERRWNDRLTPAERDAWRNTGTRDFFHFGEKRLLPLHHAFLTDLARHEPWPRTSVPTLVLQGLRDDVVEPALVRRWVHDNPAARLVELDGDHELGDVLPALLAHADAFLDTVPAARNAFARLPVDTPNHL